jgi:hypothetical protein
LQQSMPSAAWATGEAKSAKVAPSSLRFFIDSLRDLIRFSRVQVDHGCEVAAVRGLR